MDSIKDTIKPLYARSIRQYEKILKNMEIGTIVFDHAGNGYVFFGSDEFVRIDIDNIDDMILKRRENPILHIPLEQFMSMIEGKSTYKQRELMLWLLKDKMYDRG